VIAGVLSRAPVRQRLTLVDWRTLAPADMQALYVAEAARWTATLEWDTRQAWPEIERGRVLGTVGGVVALDERRAPVGWSYCLVHGGALQIGGFTAAADAVAPPLLEWILSRPEHTAVDRVSFFAYADAPSLTPLLRARGLAVERYWYLARDIHRGGSPPLSDARLWRADDLVATAELFARAYNDVDETRPIAPRGGATAWTEYVRQLATGPGCGRLLPQASIAVPGGPSRLLAVALVTTIAEGTAHLAQIAVDPQLQGQKVGSQLLEAACALAGQSGFERITLLVGGRNARARALYESARFEPKASFISAGTLQPRRSTSVAPGLTAIARR
jgi:ribosomal protein S18 acetylase RimI-like enzyme